MRLFVCGALLLLLAGPALSVGKAALDPQLTGRGWMEIRFDGKMPNAFLSCGDSCIKVISMDSVSMISKEYPVQLSDTPLLSWQWMLGQPAARSDLTKKGQDDRAVAVYVAFPYDSKNASLAEVLFRPFVELAKGENAPGRVISYVFLGGGDAKRGKFVKSPYLGGHGVTKIVRNADDKPRSWIFERVNVVEYYKKFFGDLPNSVSHILISPDSDDTGVESMAYVRKIAFHPLSARKPEN